MKKTALNFVSGIRFLLSASILIIGARIAGGLIGFGTQILIARTVGVEELGIYFLAIGIATVLSILCCLGYPWIIARHVAEYESRGRSVHLSAFLAFVRRNILVACLALVVPAVIIILIYPFSNPHMQSGLLVGVLTAPLFAFIKLNSSLANAQKRIRLSFLPDLFSRPAAMFCFIVVFIFAFDSLTLLSLLIGHFLIVLLLLVVQTRGLFWSKRADVMATSPNPGDEAAEDLPDFRQLRRHAFPMMLATLFIGTFADLDIIILGTLMQERDLAIFSVCLKIALFLAFAVQSCHQLILRDAADALRLDDRSYLMKTIAQANVLGVFFSLVALVIVIFWGPIILGAFGPSFVAGHVSLVILVGAQLVRSAAGPAAQILTLTGFERQGLPIFAGSFILLIVANLAFVPAFGQIGAAFAVLLVTAAWSVGLAVLVKRRTRIPVYAYQLG